MTHPKTGDEELERRLTWEKKTGYTCMWLGGYRAAELETELLRKRIEKLRNLIVKLEEFLAHPEGCLIEKSKMCSCGCRTTWSQVMQALAADDKASEGGV